MVELIKFGVYATAYLVWTCCWMVIYRLTGSHRERHPHRLHRRLSAWRGRNGRSWRPA